MTQLSNRAARVLLVVLLALCLPMTVRSASAGPTDPAPADPTWPDTLVRDYTAAYPTLTPAQVRARLDEVGTRKELAARWSKAFPKTFAGTWYDFEADLMHVATTDDRQRSGLVAEGAAAGVGVAGHLAQHSLNDLERTRERVRSGRLLSGVGEQDQVRLDLATNSVTLGVGSTDRRRLARTALPAGLRLVPVVAETAGVPAACVDRNNCGAPLRSGVNIGTYFSVTADIGCSMGFTASATDGSRWALTAGHCVPQSHVDTNRLWGHGGQYIGPARQRYDAGQVDVARIRMDNPYWRRAGGGYFYRTPTTTAEVDLAITLRTTIEVDDPVCMSGRRYVPGDDSCGRVSDLFAHRDMVQVSGLKACGGDSGGGAYLLSSAGRWAYGLLNSTSVRNAPGDCTTSSGQINISPLPEINRFFDSRSPGVPVRVETR